MRLFEVVVIVALAAGLVVPLGMRRLDRWALVFSAAAFVGLLTHLILEKFRWQMIPLYILVLVMAGIALFSLARGAGSTRWPVWVSAIGLIALIPSALLPYVFPVPEVPGPTGDFAVGSFSAMLTDEGRKEIFSSNSEEPRSLMIQVWYPAKLVQGLARQPWVDHPEVVAPSISRWLEFPDFFLDHVSLATSHSWLDAPLADTPVRLPVVTFSHGWNGIRQQSTYLMEELASHGYLVVSIEHTYGARVVVFPDGRVVENNPRALPYNDPPEIAEPAADILGNQWAEDIGFVLDTLARWNENDPAGRLTGRLDLSRVGISGHSTGGGAASEFCGRDVRCKALLGLDAYLTPVSDEVIERGLEQPALLLFSERWPDAKNNALLAPLLARSPLAQEASVMGTAHYDFSDLPLLSPLAPVLGLKGPLKAETALAINRACALALFNGVLGAGDLSTLRTLASAYPELKFDHLP